MYAAFWLALLIVAGILFDIWLTRQHNPNIDPEVYDQEDGAVSVVLVRNRAGHYLASGTINGHAVTFMIDTGASDVAIPQPLAKRIGLPMGMARTYRTANGSVTGYTTSLDRVTLGPLELRTVAGSILPELPDDTVLLGMSFLRRVEIWQRAGRLTLRQLPPGR